MNIYSMYFHVFCVFIEAQVVQRNHLKGFSLRNVKCDGWSQTEMGHICSVVTSSYLKGKFVFLA